MEPIDQQLDQALRETEAPFGPANVMIVGGTAAQRRQLERPLTRAHHACTTVTSVEDARGTLGRKPCEVMLIDLAADGGEGRTLLRDLPRIASHTRAIAFTASGSLEGAVEAMRDGAIDYVATDGALDDLVARVERAALLARRDRQREERICRLKRICREVNLARHEVSEQVDSLCNELAGAYREMTERVDEVTTATEFRTLLRQELDVEELLRTALEYLLTKTGPTNAAVFLPDGESSYNLGAYVNYDCSRDSIATLLDHLGEVICPEMADEDDIIRFEDTQEFGQWIGLDENENLLGDSHVVAMSCRHDDECLAVIVLFRSAKDPIDEPMIRTLHLLRTIFAEQLGNVIHVHHRAAASWPSEAADDEIDFDDYGFGFGDAAAA